MDCRWLCFFIGYSLAVHRASGMKKRKWTMKRIVDTLFVLVILGDIATMMMFVMISIKILKMQEVITYRYGEYPFNTTEERNWVNELAMKIGEERKCKTFVKAL